jgi:hypothetical protein
MNLLNIHYMWLHVTVTISWICTLYKSQNCCTHEVFCLHQTLLGNDYNNGYSLLPYSHPCCMATVSQLNHEGNVNVILRPTFSRSVCLGVKYPSWPQGQSFVTVRQLQVCLYGVPSLMRGRVYRLQLLLSLASAVILTFESLGTNSRILLSQTETLRTWRARSPYLYPQGRGWLR